MEQRTAAALAVLVVLMGSPASSQTLTVRIFNNYDVAAEDLQEARAHAAVILDDAGLDIVWEDCWQGNNAVAHASPRCREAVGPSDLVLRLQRSHAAKGERFTSLGYALVGTHGLPFLATIYVDRVRSVSRGAAVNPHAVLGRAIAHEIGHVLLNNNRHAERGLMRAAWTHTELQRGEARDWRFLEHEAAQIRSVLNARAAN